MTDEDRHRVRARELAVLFAGRAAISHESAALLHRLQLPPINLVRVHATWPGSAGRRGTSNIHPHRGLLDETDLVIVDGTLVTSVARTVFDIARTAMPSVAVAAADSALRSGAVSRAALRALLDRSRRVTGHRKALHVIEFADPRAESVGESICRVRMAQLGIPTPTPQAVIGGVGLEFDPRVDFEIDGFGTVVEFDGRIKYGRLVPDGKSAGDVVFDEKRREDAIRATGRECVRIVWDELRLDRYPALLPRFASAFGRAGHPTWQPGHRQFLTR
ncbi:hypothetical protein ABIB25_003772 [Nakamurella sp. UYEF19]|uniref:hypothetical protein n=1 Tax=Nakamurella sp. UYEF19 TaxID=1756392 RepID=UPI00339528AE